MSNEIIKTIKDKEGWNFIVISGDMVSDEDYAIVLNENGYYLSFGGCQLDDMIKALKEVKEHYKKVMNE